VILCIILLQVHQAQDAKLVCREYKAGTDNSEVDKVQFTGSQHNPIAAKKMKTPNCLSCHILAKNIKRVADHACDIIDKEFKPKYKISLLKRKRK
jgi:phosphate uptake regulator